MTSEEIAQWFIGSNGPVANRASMSYDTLDQSRATLQASGVFVPTLLLRSDDDDESVLRLSGEALHLPTYFGGNWNALDDCLFDVDWFGSVTGCCLMVVPATRNDRLPETSVEQLVEAAETASRYWAERHKPLKLLRVDVT